MKSQAVEKQSEYPLLETERLLLRGFKPQDLESAYELFNDAEVQRYLSPKNRRTREQLKVSLKKLNGYWQKRGFSIFCVTEKKTGEMIGYCGFQHLEDTENVEIVFALLKRFWGKGFATEAAKDCLKYGFENLRFEKIYAETVPDNIASRFVIEKLGMKYDEKTVYYQMNVVVYSISRNEFFGYNAE